MGDTTYDRLDEALEKAVLDADCWVEAIEEAAQILGGEAASLMPINPQFRGVWIKISSSVLHVLDEYMTDGWYLNDYRQRLSQIIEKLGYATDDDILSSREERNSIPFYRDLVLKHNIGFVIATTITTSNGLWGLVVYLDNDHPPITDEQIEYTKEIRIRFETATRKADEIAHQQISNFAKFFNNTKTEIHLFDALGDHCLKLNNQGGFSGEASTKPSYLTEHVSAELYEELKEICTSDPAHALSKSRQVSLGGQKLNLLAIQVPNALRHYHMIFKVCVIATQCADETSLKRANFTQHYKLTDAEVTTMELLANGNSVNSIADLLSLKPSSIRQRLKTIFEKTDVSGQVELIGLYHQH